MKESTHKFFTMSLKTQEEATKGEFNEKMKETFFTTTTSKVRHPIGQSLFPSEHI